MNSLKFQVSEVDPNFLLKKRSAQEYRGQKIDRDNSKPFDPGVEIEPIVASLFTKSRRSSEMRKRFSKLFPGKNVEGLLRDYLKGVVFFKQEEIQIAQEIMQAEMETRLPKIIDKFKRRWFAMERLGLIPIEARNNLRRLDSLKINYSYNLSFSEFGPTGYALASTVGVIDINVMRFLDEPEGFFEHVIFHELLHELDGASFMLREITYRKSPGVENLKVGLARGKGQGPHEWLNEAYKEFLARKMSGYASDFYCDELDVLLGLFKDKKGLDGKLSKGLSKTLLGEASFENWSSDSRNAELTTPRYSARGKLVRDSVLKVNPANSKYRKVIDEINRIQRERHGDDFGWLNLCRRFSEDHE